MLRGILGAVVIIVLGLASNFIGHAGQALDETRDGPNVVDIDSSSNLRETLHSTLQAASYLVDNIADQVPLLYLSLALGGIAATRRRASRL